MKKVLIAITLITMILFVASYQRNNRIEPSGMKTPKEIKIGHTVSYTGNDKWIGTTGLLAKAYFKELNNKNGINGRKINFISLDDSGDMNQTKKNVVKLIEEEKVDFLALIASTARNKAILDYQNKKQVPNVFLYAENKVFFNPEKTPWTVSFGSSNDVEGRIIGKYIKNNYKNKKLGILYQDDEAGLGWANGLGAVLKNTTISTTKLNISNDSANIEKFIKNKDLLFLAYRGAKLKKTLLSFVDKKITLPLFFPMASGIKLMTSNNRKYNSLNIYSSFYLKDPNNKQFSSDSDSIAYFKFMKKHYPEGDVFNEYNYRTFSYCETIKSIIEKLGDNITNENVIHQTTHLDKSTYPLLIDGINVKQTKANYTPIGRIRMGVLKEKDWEFFGKPISAY